MYNPQLSYSKRIAILLQELLEFEILIGVPCASAQITLRNVGLKCRSRDGNLENTLITRKVETT